MDARGIVPQDRQDEPHAADLSNDPAITSLVFGILAFVIQLLAWGLTTLARIQYEAALDRWATRVTASGDPPQSSSGVAGIIIASFISLPLGIGAIVSGVRGRRVAKAEGPNRMKATVGLVLGMISVAIPIVALLAFLAWVSCCVDTL
jgi:hypothetical protein